MRYRFSLAYSVLAAVCGTAAPGEIEAQALAHVETYFDGQTLGGSTIDGLNFAWATAVSPDGTNVYACSGVANVAGGDADDNAIAVFSRDLDSGRLAFEQVLFDDDDANSPGTANGLLSCRSVLVSPDGLHVYTAGSSDDAVGVFARSVSTGHLTYLSSVIDGVGGVEGLDGATSLAITADGESLFVVGRADDALAVFRRDVLTGSLTFEDFAKNGVGGVQGLDRPLSVALSPGGEHAYVVSGSNANFSGSDALTAFAWDAVAGQLTFVAAYFEGAAQGGNTIDGLRQVTSVAVSPDGASVYTAAEVDTVGGATGNGNDWIAIFSRQPSTGALTWQQRIAGFRICDSFFGADAESFLAMSSDGQRLYVTKNWQDNGVAMFARSAIDGALTFLDGECEFAPVEIGMNLPRMMALDPTGRDLYVAGNASDSLVWLDTSAIFTDGFESGDLARWSGASP